MANKIATFNVFFLKTNWPWLGFSVLYNIFIVTELIMGLL